MKTNKFHRSWTLKQLLFAYLAITKVWYWLDTLSGIDTISAFGTTLLTRMLQQDIMVVIVLICMFTLDDFVTSREGNTLWATAKTHIIGLFIFLALILGWHFFISATGLMTANITDWGAFVLQWSILYAIFAGALTAKDKLKKKEAEQYIPDASTDEGKISMLNSLCEAGVLTREECNLKIKEACEAHT
jgi:hypothetical protein